MIMQLLALLCAAAYDVCYCVAAWKEKKTSSALYGVALALLCAAAAVMLFII